MTEKFHKASQGSIMDKWALSGGQHRKRYRDASLENWQFSLALLCISLNFCCFSLIIFPLGSIVTMTYILWLAEMCKGAYGFCFYSAIFRHNHFVHGTSMAIYGNDPPPFFFEQMGIIKTRALKCGAIQDIKHFLQSSSPAW